MQDVVLRPYQEAGIKEVYSNLRSEQKKIIFWLATGGGKTTIFVSIIRELVNYNIPVILIVKRRELVKQASNKLLSLGIEHGVYMANHYLYYPARRVQVCSIDTLSSRSAYPMADTDRTVVIIDESHDIRKSSEKYSKILEVYERNVIIGFTATPFADNSWAQSIVCPIDPSGLRDQGYLVPCRTFVPSIIDCSGIKVESTGDYNQRDLAIAVNRPHITGDVIDSWVKLASNKRTMLFAVNIEHSKSISQSFTERGIPSKHADAETPDHERETILNEFREGKIKVLCNVNIFSTGLDVTEIEAISFVRPTKSLIYFLQAIGRGLRPSHNIGKKEVIIIDHAGNTLDFGDAYYPRTATLEPRKDKGQAQQTPFRVCKQCFFVFEGAICPSCGFVNPKIERKITHGDGQLIEFTLPPEELEKIRKKNFISDYYKLSHVKRKNRLFGNWHYQQLLNKYGIEFCKKYSYDVSFPETLLGK